MGSDVCRDVGENKLEQVQVQAISSSGLQGDGESMVDLALELLTLGEFLALVVEGMELDKPSHQCMFGGDVLPLLEITELALKVG